MLVDTIKTRIRQAMKDKNTVEREILGVALGEIQTAEARGSGPISTQDAEAILRKLVKSNRETLDASTDEGQRAVLEREIEILQSLLPKSLSVDEIETALDPVADSIRGAANDGQATGVAMKHLKSSGARVEGKDVAEVVKRLRA